MQHFWEGKERKRVVLIKSLIYERDIKLNLEGHAIKDLPK